MRIDRLNSPPTAKRAKLCIADYLLQDVKSEAERRRRINLLQEPANFLQNLSPYMFDRTPEHWNSPHKMLLTPLGLEYRYIVFSYISIYGCQGGSRFECMRAA